MQTPKQRKSSSESSQKISPRSVSSEGPQRVTSRAIRQLKTTGLEIDSASSSNQPIKTPKNASPKITERRSPRSPVTEKKRPSKVSELESQISQLQEDLKNVKDQLISSESWKKEAQQDAEESRKQLLIMSLKLEESQKLLAHSNSEEAQGIQNLIEEEDQAWKSKLEIIERQHSVDSAALTTARNEIEQLKVQLESLVESEATKTLEAEFAFAELESLKGNLAENLSTLEDMKSQLNVCRESEAQAQALVGQTLSQLEIAKKTIESLKSDGNKSVEEYDAISLELDQSKARVEFLEDLVNKLNEARRVDEIEREGRDEMLIEAEILSLKSEVEKLKSALEIADMRYNEEQIRSTVELESARELVEQIKSSSSVKAAELAAELQKSKADIEELKANLMDKETELQGICEENDDLNTKLKNTLSGQREIELEKERKKLKNELDNLRASLMDKETECQYISEENKKLRSEIEKNEIDEVEEGGDGNLAAARAAEREALMKLSYMKEETDKSNKKIARVTEQLEAAQAANLEMEAELRRLKVQSDQWRKAAEAAAAMLSTGNGKFVERTGSLDSNYSPVTGRINSPYSEDMDDDFLKKKNGNVLKRIGVLWKKPQNKAP